MASAPFLALGIVVLTTVAMEAVAFATHKYVMHGWGWGWHRSHHEPRSGRLEKNDLYAVAFLVISIACFTAGHSFWAIYWIGSGMAVYGLAYFVVHDGLVHRRFPCWSAPRAGYLRRLVQAHHLHHLVREQTGCVSFGFLYAPPVEVLRRRLRERRLSE